MWTALEWTAVVFGLDSVWLSRAESVWCWPTGLINIAFLGVILLGQRLYIDVGLQVVMTVLSVYGWICWARPGPRSDELPIRRIRGREAALWAGATLAATLALGAGFGRYTAQAVPYWNAATVVLQAVAQVLLARKVLENWALWIAADVLMIAEYIYVHLPWAAVVQFALFLALAILGYCEWWRRIRRPHAA